MAMLKKVEIHYIKCDPKKPNAAFNKDNPSWEVQIRTADPKVRDEWKAMGLAVKLLTKKDPDADPELGDDAPKLPVLNSKGEKQWRVNLKKGSIKKDKTKAEPVKVMRGDLSEIDPNTVGNGSLANVRIYTWPSKDKDGKDKVGCMLMAIQVIKHIIYTPKARDDDFDMEETETVVEDGNDDNDDAPQEGGDSKPAVKKPVAPAHNEDDY